MKYLLDTNVISETIKKQPDKNAIKFLSSININNIFLSSITIGEIKKDICKLEDVSKKQKILFWLENDLQTKFYGRIIDIDAEVASKWGHISFLYNNLPAIDGLIAASALTHNCSIVTRNQKDFAMIKELEIINPWLFDTISQ